MLWSAKHTRTCPSTASAEKKVLHYTESHRRRPKQLLSTILVCTLASTSPNRCFAGWHGGCGGSCGGCLDLCHPQLGEQIGRHNVLLDHLR